LQKSRTEQAVRGAGRAVRTLALFGALVLSTPSLAQDSADQRLSALGEALHRYRIAQSGEIELTNGNTKPGDRLPSATPATRLEQAAQARRWLAELEAIDPTALSPAARIDAAVLRNLLETELGDARFREWEMPFDSDNNFWSYLASPVPLDSAEDYRRYIARMRDIPRYFAEHTANARAGLKRGFSVPRVTLEGRDASLAHYVVEDPKKSPFWAAFAVMPARISTLEQDLLRAEALEVIREQVTPAYAEVLRFFRQDYLPRTRTTLGASVLPDGKAFYAQQIREFTTLDLTAEQIHKIGLDEVARIAAEMEKVREEAGFKGTLPEFVQFLRSDPQFVAKTPDELMGVSAYVAKRVDGRLKDFFGFLPRYRFAIRPVDPAIAPFYTAGRGGLEYCQMNTWNLPSRPLYNIPALTLHECAPGHSMQAAIALEQPEMPRFRRQVYFSGFGEGWGLYTEFLGEEMGIYRTPCERFGKLSYEMWRAVRLVIDTGIHHYGWSREQAIDYLKSRTALSEHEVNTEVDRYISWPGQALAYKLGELTIRRVRAKAEKELGAKFDIRKFHDVVLSLGSVPLDVLEKRIDAFIADSGQGLPGVKYE
jgi:uncharacterized protein (DUF885 family)